MGELLIRSLLPGSFPGASRPLPSLWPLAPPLSYPGHPPASRGGSHRPPGRPRCCTLLHTRAAEGGDPGGGSPNSGGRVLSAWVSGDISFLLLAFLGILAASRSPGVRLGVASRRSPDCTSETALSARAWPPPNCPSTPPQAFPRTRRLLPSYRGAGVASTSAISPARGWSPQAQRGEPGRVGRRSEPRGARAGLAGGLGNRGAQAPCLGRAPLPGRPRRGSRRAEGFSLKGCPG